MLIQPLKKFVHLQESYLKIIHHKLEKMTKQEILSV